MKLATTLATALLTAFVFAEEDYWIYDDFRVDHYVAPYGWDVNGDEAVLMWGNPDILSGKVEIPKTVSDGGRTWRVTRIGEYAFCDGHTDITSVTIPEGVTAIDEGAFEGCTSLETLSLPSTLEFIGWGVFNECVRLGKVAIPAETTMIDESAFMNCGAVSFVVDEDNWAYRSSPEGGLLSKDGTRLLCASIQNGECVVPESVEALGDCAFFFDALKTIHFKGGVPRLATGDDRGFTFNNTIRQGTYMAAHAAEWEAALNDGKWKVWLKEDNDDEDDYESWYVDFSIPMEHYGLWALTGNAKYLKYEGGVITGLSSKTFSGELIIPSEIEEVITAISPGAFDGATQVTSITVPGSVREIQAGTFRNLSALTTVTLQEGVESLRAGAFDSCAKLTKVFIPASVSTIEEGTFRSCGKIAFEVAEGNAAYRSDEFGALLSKDGERLIAVPGVSSYVVPGSVRIIQAGTFSGLSDLASVTLSNGVETIRAGAFDACAKLAKVIIPASATTIETGAFTDCKAITFTVDEENSAYCSDASGALLSREGPTLLAVPGTVTNYDVPEGISMIADQAFGNAASLTDVTLPASVAEIGTDAFAGCAKLAKVTFLGQPPETVADGAFGSCTVGVYPQTFWREWTEVMTEGIWHGLTMTTTPFFVTINCVGSGSITDSDGTKISSFPKRMSYLPGHDVTLTATPFSGYVTLGWSGEGIKGKGETVTFAPDAVKEITVHFVTKSVADSLEAVGVGTDSSLEEALANGEVFTKEQILDMALGAPLIEVQEGKATVSITLETVDTLGGEWQPVKPDAVTVSEDGIVSVHLEAEGDKRFFKFVVPNAQ